VRQRYKKMRGKRFVGGGIERAKDKSIDGDGAKERRREGESSCGGDEIEGVAKKKQICPKLGKSSLAI